MQQLVSQNKWQVVDYASDVECRDPGIYFCVMVPDMNERF